MACTFMHQEIPFVLNVEITCGYYYDTSIFPPGPIEFNYNMILDHHCVYCVKKCVVEQAELANGQFCEIDVDVTSLIGALHYDMIFAGFKQVLPNGGGPEAIFTKGQSICVEDLRIGYNCKTECNLPPGVNNADCCKNVVYTPELSNAMLYTNTELAGIPLFDNTDPAHLWERLTPTAVTALNKANAQGCKTIVMSGKIKITD